MAAPSATYTALDQSTCAAAPNQYDGMTNKSKNISGVQRQISDDYLKPLPDDEQYDYISTPTDASDDPFTVAFHKY